MTTQYIYDLVDTWASGGGPYTSIKMNATDNDAASASLLMDLQVGGSPKLNIDKAGSTKIFGHQGAYQWADAYRTYGLSLNSAGVLGASVAFFIEPTPGDKKIGLLFSVDDTNAVAIIKGTSSNRLSIESDSNIIFITGGHYEFEGLQNTDPIDVFGYQKGSAIGKTINFTNLNQTPTYAVPLRVTSHDNNLEIQQWYQATTKVANVDKSGKIDAVSFSIGGDTYLTRRAAANLRFGADDAAAPVAQTLSVQSVVAGTSNTAGANLTITGSQGTGTGAGGSIILQVAAAGSSGSAQNALATALTINSARLATFESNLYVKGSNYVYAGAAGILQSTENQGLGLQSTMPLRWSSAASYDGTFDTYLHRDAANTLALRNGTAAQEMRVYENTTGTIYKAILGNRQLIKIAGAAFDNGAGASAGTLTNAPAVGNPTKWIPIDDNGTTRHIPAW